MPISNNHDFKAILVGGILILAVGGYFIGRAVFFPTETPKRLAIENDGTPKKDTPTITAETLQQKLTRRENVRLIDVRTEESYQAEHLPGSVFAPLSALTAFAPENGETLVIILSGNDDRAFEAAGNILSEKSFSYSFLKGGFAAWKEGGYPTVSAGDPNSFLDQSKVSYLSSSDLKKIFEENADAISILDVQQTENFSKRHLRGAMNIPLEQLEKRINEVPSGKTIIVYGENEIISFQGGVRLFDLNVFGARVLTGNNNLSLVSGLPLE